MKRLTGSVRVSFPSSISARIATLVSALVWDAMRKIVSGAIFVPASLSAQPTARSYTGLPSWSTRPTAPLMRFSSTYCWRTLSMRARRSVEKVDVGPA